MSNLADIIRYQKSQGKGVASAAATGIKERLKEKFDPRKMFNQKGLMTALFPALKAYKAKTKNELSDKKDLLSSSTDTSSILPVLQDISFNTKTTAKNMTVLPILSREFNVIRQNFVRLVKGRLIQPATKADAFFQKSKEREQYYENLVKSSKATESKTPTKIEEKDRLSSLILAVIPVALIGALVYQIKKMEDNDIFDGIVGVYQDMKDAYETIQINIEQEKIYKELNSINYKELTGLQKDALLKQDEILGRARLAEEMDKTNNPGAIVDSSSKELQLKKYKTKEEGRQAQDEYWKSQSENGGLGEAARRNYGKDKTAPIEEKRRALEETKAILESTKTGSAKEMKPQQESSSSRRTPKVYSSVDLGDIPAVDKFKNAKDILAYGKMYSVDNILLHHTGGATAAGAITQMTTSNNKDNVQYAAQFVVDKNGNVLRVRNDTDIVNHVGATNKGFEHVKNSNTIGIEIVGRNSSDFNDQQIQSVKALVKKLQMKYGVSSERIYGHGEVAGGRKMHSEGTDLAKELRKEIKLEASPRKPGEEISSVKDLGRALDLNSTEVALLEEFMNKKQVTYVIQQTNVQNNNTTVISQNQSKSNFSKMVQMVA